MNQTKTNITIVTVNWNRKKDVNELLKCLEDQSDQLFDTIVVDNGSVDGSQDEIEGSCREVKLVKLDRNIGIPAYNIGVSQARGEYTILLDNDVLLPSDFIAKVKQAILVNPDIKVFALNILDPDGKRQQDYLPQQADKPLFWHNFIGGGVVFKTDLFNRLGGFNPDYFIYINETELSARILAADEKILYCSDIVITHKTSPHSRSSATAFYHYVRNSLLFFSTYYPPRERVDLVLGFTLINLKKSIQEKLLSTLIKAIAGYIRHKKTAVVQLNREHRNRLRLCWQGDPSLSAILRRRLDTVF